MKTAKEIYELYKITPVTLMHWRNSGKIKFKKITSKTFLYDDSEIIGKRKEERKSYYYARVSTSNQKRDLDKQVEILKEYMLKNGIKPEGFQDIASGMNENRDGLNNLMKEVVKGNVETIYIMYKDRLSRFGFGYLENICNFFDTKIEILMGEDEGEKEFTNDLISIIHSIKMSSERKKKLNKLKNELLNETRD